MFTFDEEKHEYRLDGEKLPSVTNIISEFSDFSRIPKRILENKRLLGTEFHRVITLHLLDDLIYDSIDERLKPPFDAFLNWSRPNLDEFRKGLFEQRMYNRKLWVAGTCDLATYDNLFDWKLRLYNPVVDVLQLAGYDILLKQRKHKRWTVCVTLKGKLSVHRSEHTQANKMFLYMLKCLHANKQNGKIYQRKIESWKGQFN